MAFLDRPRPASSLPTPPPGHLIQFIDENGTPSVIDSDRVVTPSATLTGDPLILDEQVGDPTTGAGEIAVYNKQGEGLQQRAPNNGPVTALGGGGSGTFFDDSQSASLDDLLATMVTGYEWNTGIVLPTPVDNSTLSIHFESRSVGADGNGVDSGWFRYTLAWDTAPAVPGSIDVGIAAAGIAGDATVFSSQLQDIQLNASNELVIVLDNNLGVDIQLLLKVTVSPVTVLPFAPVGVA